MAMNMWMTSSQLAFQPRPAEGYKMPPGTFSFNSAEKGKKKSPPCTDCKDGKGCKDCQSSGGPALMLAFAHEGASTVPRDVILTALPPGVTVSAVEAPRVHEIEFIVPPHVRPGQRVEVRVGHHMVSVDVGEDEVDARGCAKKTIVSRAPSQPSQLLQSSPAAAAMGKTQLLLVSDALPDYELLVQSASPTTQVLVVKFDSWTFDDLAQQIQQKVGEPTASFGSIGLLEHGSPGHVFLLRHGGILELDALEDRASPAARFFEWIAGYLNRQPGSPNRIDLLACSEAGSKAGRGLVRAISR